MQAEFADASLCKCYNGRKVKKKNVAFCSASPEGSGTVQCPGPSTHRLGKPAQHQQTHSGWHELPLPSLRGCCGKIHHLLVHSPVWIWNFWKCNRKYSSMGKSYQIPQFCLEYYKTFPSSLILAAVAAQLLQHVEKNYRSSKNCPWFHRLWLQTLR